MFVRPQAVLVMLLISRQKNSTTFNSQDLKILQNLAKKTKVVEESNFSQSESQLLCITVSKGSEYNSVSLIKQFG